LTDNRTIGGLEYHPELVGFSGLDPEKLAPLVPMHEPIGPLLPEVAAELGLSPETLVFPGLNDSQCAAIACGTLRGEHAGLSIGTTSVLLAHVDRKDTDTTHAIFAMPSPIKGRYIVMAENGLGGRTLEHVLRSYVFVDDALARHALAGADPFAGVEAAAQSVAPGSEGVVFLPWLAGSLAPRPDGSMRGAFLNLSLASTRAHLTRAVLEGVALNLRWLLSPVEAFAQRSFSHVVFGGGAARSRIWSQILADVLDRPIHRLADPHLLNARAAALYALTRAGHADMALLDAPTIEQLHAPDPGHRASYDRLFTQFVAAFEANRPIFAALNG
jgi:xylulokinase